MTASAALSAYRFATWASAPLVRGWLELRRLRGKEDITRLHERFGTPSLERPPGPVVWCHAASVGEMMSCLHLLKNIRTQRPDIHILLTTGTVTSARLAEQKTPEGVAHQYVPVDLPDAVEPFLTHWRPDLALWLESELWPNLLLGLKKRAIPVVLINARMSPRSARSWARMPAAARALLSCFTAIYAGSHGDAERYRSLGAHDLQSLGNIKYDAPALPADANALAGLTALFGPRPVWCAASTHPGEEKHIITVHKQLAAAIPNLLTVLAPRHSIRGQEIATLIEKSGLRVARRSAHEGPSPTTSIYLADTMGELGNLFRLCQIVFVGGSLVKRGGHNLIEPARLGCALITGPFTHNFTDIVEDFTEANAVEIVPDANALSATVLQWLRDPELRAARAAASMDVVNAHAGAARIILKHVLQLLPPEPEGARAYERAS